MGDIMTGVAFGAGNAYSSGAPDFTPGFHRGSCCPVICVFLFHVIVLSFDFEFWLFLLFDCLVSIFFTLKETSGIVRNVFIYSGYFEASSLFLIIKNYEQVRKIKTEVKDTTNII